MLPKTVEELEKEYINEEWQYIDAIQYLQDHFGYTAKEAEAKVENWED